MNKKVYLILDIIIITIVVCFLGWCLMSVLNDTSRSNYHCNPNIKGDCPPDFGREN